MAFKTAEEAFAKFQETGEYMNNDSHFEGTPEERRALFGAYKHMVPKEAKVAFRQKVAGNENRAIEGLMQGKTREEMGILNQKEHGQALYRRLGAGLGTGLDLNKAYDWGSGNAREVGTTDIAKWNTNRGITDTERARYADFSRAGSPEAYWSGYRQNQISGLLNSGAIAQDAQGYYNPGPGGGDRYGANLEGYNFGRGPMGNGTNLGGPAGTGGGSLGAYAPSANPGYSPGSYQSPTYPQPTAQPQAQPTQPQTPSYTPPANNSGFTGGAYGSGNVAGPKAPQVPNYMAGGTSTGARTSGQDGLNSLLSGKDKNGTIYAAGGYSAPVQPPGPLPDGGQPLVVHPGEQVNVTPAAQNPNLPFNGQGSAGQIAGNLGGQGVARPAGSTREVGPGGGVLPGSSPFGSNPVPLPTGNGLVPGSGGGSSSSSGGPGSGGYTPTSLPGVGLPGQIPLGNSNPLAAPGGSGLASQGGMDTTGQRFNLDRARGEYAGAQGLERGILGIYGDILGFDPETGAARDASDSNNRSFAYLAPQAQRITADADALVKRLEATLPPGGERDAAIAQALRGAQADISGGRQALMGQALEGVNSLAQSKKGFDPQYVGANQSLLDAYGNLRGQDLSTLLGSRGQDIQGLLGARGQDVQWGLGQGQLGLGYDQLQQGSQQNLWDTYLRGREQDMNLYSNTRGQDLQSLQARQALQAQRAQADRGFWGNLLGTVGGLAGGLFGGPAGAAVGSKAGGAVGGGGFGLGS
jgi:hypothetical protein